MSERATVALRGGEGDVTLRLIGEATRRYFSRPSRLTVTAGGQAIATVDIGRDFDAEVRVRRDLLEKSDGRVSLESDQMFTPGDREGTADRRHLAVRIYSVAVRAQGPK
jgi:hypothetical protein